MMTMLFSMGELDSGISQTQLLLMPLNILWFLRQRSLRLVSLFTQKITHLAVQNPPLTRSDTKQSILKRNGKLGCTKPYRDEP